MLTKSFKHIACALLASFSLLSYAQGNDSKQGLTSSLHDNWQHIVAKAKGQTVYFNAWGGSQEINEYLRWANQELQQQYGVTLKQVKVADISETVQRLVAEKAAGKNHDGSVDMVWINGENFRTMKQNNLLFGPFVHQLPNWALVNKKLPVEQDFTQATEGYEAPWGVGQLVFIYDSAKLSNPPKSFTQLLTFAQQHPGKVSYPKPPEFHGSSFLKAALLELTPDKKALYQPLELPQDQATFDRVTAPLWHYLDQLHKVAWQQGKKFPSGSAEIMQLLDDQQLLLAITFNPNAAKAAIENGNLTETAKTYAFDQGALTNVHFLAIPWNAQAKEGAMVAINFLMSPQAQARKADTTIWGDPTVLTTQALQKDQAKGQSTFQLYKAISEPDPSWLTAIEHKWQQRYGN